METTAPQPRIKQNLDTNFLKLIAIVSMTIDHFYKAFWPDNFILALIGRMAFPLFAYCLVVGCLYTRSIKKYLLRLSIFAVVSQPFFVMAFHPTWQGFVENILVANIFFTLVAGVLVVSALMDIKKRWWMIGIALLMEIFLGLDYGLYGIVMMAIFYLCRNNSKLSLLFVFLWMCWTSLFGDFVHIFGVGIDLQFFALLALPLIYIHTSVNPKIPKFFFYGFYPAHLLVLFFCRRLFGV